MARAWTTSLAKRKIGPGTPTPSRWLQLTTFGRSCSKLTRSISRASGSRDMFAVWGHLIHVLLMHFSDFNFTVRESSHCNHWFPLASQMSSLLLLTETFVRLPARTRSEMEQSKRRSKLVAQLEDKGMFISFLRKC